MMRADAWRILAPVLVPLRDAHSAMAPPFSGERLDLPIEWLAEGIVAASDAGDLRRGNRITAIAGRSLPELIAVLEKYVPAENGHWVRASGESMLRDLGVLRAMGLAEDAPVSVRIERNGKDVELRVGLAGDGAGAKSAREPWVRYTLHPESDLGLLTLDRCLADETYRDTLERFFRGVHEKKIGRVAVDLRRNGGGNSRVVDDFLRHVVEEYGNFGCDIRGSAALEEQRKHVVRGVESYRPGKRRQPVHADPPPFRGELHVITGRHTFSSGSWFACIVQDNGLGKVIGEPTGNAPSSFGDVLSFRLPGTGLSFTLSHKRWIRPDPARDPADTLTPDIPIVRTAADVREGRDAVLEHLRGAR
jgi:C-terminal processing protease CtpA/Prc